MTPEDKTALKKLGNMNLNSAKKSLEVIRRKSKFNALVNELVIKTTNHGISKKGVMLAKQSYNGINPYDRSSLEAKVHDIFKNHVVSIYGRNRYKVATGKSTIEVNKLKKKTVNPNSPPAKEIKEEIGGPTPVKPRINASKRTTKGANTTFLQRIGATADVQPKPQPPTKAVSRTNRGKAAQRKNRTNNNGLEAGPPLD